MKANMKLKSTLWALAFAVAAVSCSDDLEENGPGNNNENVTNGGYFMSVNIATGGGSFMTKANGEGDTYLEEEGKEDMVYDVNVFLVSGTDNSADLLDLLNSADASTIQIAGQGYTSIENGLTPDGGTEPNHDKVEVEMQLTEPIPGTNAQTYQVFTVVNAGVKLSNISTLANLRDYVHSAAVWSGTAGQEDKFVMSTHKMTGVPGNSVVTLSAANMSESNPAVTNVYVERLAARIDLKVAETLLSTGYSTTDQTAIANGKGTFKLTGYTVVNRWNGDSYMFKQVSPTVNAWNVDLPDASATYVAGDPKKYLGDEKWVQTGTVPAGSYNYVIEPKTREKIGTNFMTASYLNPFSEDGDLNTLTSNNEWVTTLTNLSSSAFKKIAYTKENTMSVKNQLNGYSTGVIFESEFTPNKNFKVSKYGNGVITEVELESSNKTFYMANHQKGNSTQKVTYADLKTIAAMAFDGISAESMTTDMYKGFMDGTWPSADPELTNIQGLIDQMKESNKVESAFKTYLSRIANADAANWASVKDNLTYEKFLASTEGSDLKETNTNLFKDFGVSYYKAGKSYHKFWIRHDNNNDDKRMGVMEFCIVRNNVYQLEVSGVRDLGDPLPFTPGKDDPDNPDENDEVSILVNLYVKNWVVRSNSGIIL